ncbi:MAG: glycine betaine ABC transporter substrate-binding protein [Pseudomonadota bacterium]
MTIHKTISSVASAGVLALSVSVAGVSSASAGGVLKSAVNDWTGGAVMCEIVHQIAERELGYKIKRITMPSGPGRDEAIRAGDLDYGCELWPSYSTTIQKYVTEFGGDGSMLKIADSGVVGVSSYYVPRYLVEGADAKAPNLKSWEDMNQYSDLFKTLETGDKGRLLGCPTAAWQCEDSKRMELLGLNYAAVELGSEAAHWAEMQAAYKRKEPFIAYAWEPHWIHASLDLVKVELPEHSDDKWPATGWAKDVTFNYANPDFVKSNPEMLKLLENFRLTNEQQAPLILAIDVDGKEMDEVVDTWLKENESTWKSWIGSDS